MGLKNYFFMHLQLQQVSHNTDYGFLQASILHTLLLSQKLHVKTSYNTHLNFPFIHAC
jgi:hypothetical protein